MKKQLLIVALLVLAGIGLQAQDYRNLTEKDYASYPYYGEMMLDQSVNFYETQKAFYTYWKDRTPTRGSGYKPFKRWEYFWQDRINPDGTFKAPDYVYQEYHQYLEDHPITDGLKTGQATWEELGPKTRQNYGGYTGVGRVNAIAFHPTDPLTIYVGAPSGGFWITNDGGETWVSHTDILPTLGISSILVDQDHPEVILAGTGDRDGGDSPGLGVFRSNDGGITWEPFNEGMDNVVVGMMARCDTDPSFILAASSSGIYKTTNGGENWVKTSPDNSNYRDIKFMPGSNLIAYATSNSGYYRTEDGGETWTAMPASIGYPTGGRLVIGTTPASDSLVYLLGDKSGYNGCYLSTDCGLTFTTQSTSPNILGWAYDGGDTGSQGWYDLIIHVDPENADIVHIGGVNLWRSDDRGVTWKITGHWWGDRTNEVHADHHTFGYNPFNKRLYNGNDGGVYYTDDQGETWIEISEGLGIGQLYKIGVSATDPNKAVAGFQDNGSATWLGTHWINSGGGDGMECAIDPFDARYSYTTLYYGAITRYINNASGRRIAGEGTNGITEEGAWVTPFVLGADDGNTMVVGYKNVWISRNVRSGGTITFRKISDNLGGSNTQNMSAIKQSPVNVNTLYAIRSDSTMFRTDNLYEMAVTWIDLTPAFPASGTPTAIECHPYEANTIYLIQAGKVFKSLNKGGTWTDITGTLPNVTKKTIVYDKTSDEGLYVGTDAGVYYKDATMDDWVLYGDGLPVSVSVSELEIYYDRLDRADSKLRASSYGRGMWETSLAPAEVILPPTMLQAYVEEQEVELTWLAPFYAQNVVNYQIIRNGEVLTTFNGLNYVDNTVEEDVDYTYEIVAVYAGNILSSASNQVSVSIIGDIEIPYHQTFDHSKGGWNAKNSIEGWMHGTAEELQISGREGKFFGANSFAAGAGFHVTDYLYTPSIDLSAYAGQTITLRFASTMRQFRRFDKFSVWFRPQPEAEWQLLKEMSPLSNAAWIWDTTQIDLPEEAMTDKMQIGFFYDDSKEYAWGAAVDDVELFHNTTSIQTIDQLATLRVYPNPSHGEFVFEMNSKPGTYTLRVINNTGQVVREIIRTSDNGNLTENLDLTREPKGVYYLLISSPDGEWKEKLTVQ